MVSCNKYCFYSNNNFSSTLELKKYLQKVDSISYCDCCSTGSDNYSVHHVDVTKMERHHIDCCSSITTAIMVDSMELVKADLSFHHIMINASNSSNCIAAGILHLAYSLRFYGGAVDCD